ncbi:Na+/H+ antiporter [Paenibacillus caui]|uniref:Na+/H+ antiporter n=1 Tax=Paenibacillus caui TaxID=2873927 RepID=UPI001CA8E52E|nr:Na+/H+ antiporter [Paenibacillus caui]
MEIFFAVLVFLGLIGVSNVLNRFVPVIPVPLFQIALGALVSIAPTHIHLPLIPELFFVLFVAPLLFNDGKRMPRGELWNLRAPILLMALGLVFVTVLAAGYYIHFRIPSIPLAAAFALAAILSPTDAVAVSALAGRIRLPKRILRLLEGEALMNDASGLVAFKFAVAAAVTGVFSLTQASLSFVLIAAGGLLCGAILSVLIIRLRVFIRDLGMEDVTFHMLVQILTPFFIYLVSEELGVSGILAVVAAGIVHAVELDRVETPHYKLKITSDSTWSVILFLLNGLVFVILGHQLPDVASVIFQDPSFSNVEVIGYIMEISLLLIVLRFLWVYLFWRRDDGLGENHQASQRTRLKASLLTALSGVRGAVTLAGAFSIPFALSDGTAFPQRDLIVFIAAGVILVTLLTASVMLPLLTWKPEAANSKEQEDKREQAARLVLLQKAISVTKEEMTEENRIAALGLISYYNREIHRLRSQVSKGDWDKLREAEREIRLIGVAAERAEIERLARSGEISEEAASKCLQFVDEVEYMLTHRAKLRFTLLKILIRRLFLKLFSPDKLRQIHFRLGDYKNIKIRTSRAAIDVIKANLNEHNREVSNAVIARYKGIIYRMSAGDPGLADYKRHPDLNEHKKDLRIKAMQAERDEVQLMFERGEISRSLANKLRQFINVVEASLLDEDTD